jgi:hypothetical protein
MNDISRVCGAYGGKESSIQEFDRETRKKTLGRPRHKSVTILKSIPQNGFHKMQVIS